MKILLDGTVEIRNKKTGATKIVKPEELPDYKIPYSKFQTELEAFKKIGGKTTIETTASAELTEKEKTFKMAAESAKDAYNILQGGKVSSGPISTRFQELKQILPGAKADEGTSYRSQLAFARTILRNALLGGAISPQEAVSLEAGLPTKEDQEDIARQKLSDFIKTFGNRYGVAIDGEKKLEPTLGQEPAANITPSFDIAEPSSEKDLVRSILQVGKDTSKQRKESLLYDLLSKAANIAPGAGGLAGGLAGSILSPLGTIGGAGVGYAGGSVLQNSIRDLIGAQDKDPLSQVKDATTGAAKEAALSTLGVGAGVAFKAVAKGGQFVLKSVGKRIADIPLKSIRVNPTQLTQFAKKHGEDMGEFMVKRGYLGEDAVELATKDATKLQDAFDNLVLDSKTKIPVSTLNTRFTEEISKLAGSVEELTPKFNKGIAKTVTDEWSYLMEQAKAKGITEFTPEMLTNLRRSIDDVIPPSAFVNPNIKNTYLRLRKIYSDVIQKSVDSHLLGSEGIKGGVKDLGQELSRLYDFLEVAEKQQNLGRGASALGLIRTGAVAGGAMTGGAVGGVPGAIVGGVAGLGAEAASREPAVLKALYQTGRGVGGAVGKLNPAVNKALSGLPQAGGVSTQLLYRLLGLGGQ